MTRSRAEPASRSGSAKKRKPTVAAGEGRVGSTATRERVAAVALALLALLLHARDLTIGFPDQDLVGIDTVLRTTLSGLLRGGALPEGFTPLSRELWLWWWGKTVGLEAIGFHLLGAAVAVAAGWLILRLGRRAGGSRAGWIALALAMVFPPLGAMLSSALSARDLLALVFCAAALLCFFQRRSIATALFAAAAAASRETAALLPLAFLALDFRTAPEDARPVRVARLAPTFVAVAGVLAWMMAVAPWRIAPAPMTAIARFAASWAPPGVRPGLAAVWRVAPWLPLALVGLSFLAVPRHSRVAARAGGPSAPMLPGLWLLALGLLPLVLLQGPPRAEAFAIPALGSVLLLAGASIRFSAWPARILIAVLALVSFGANNRISDGSAGFTSHSRLAVEAARTGPPLEALRPLKSQLAATPRIFAAGFPPDTVYRLVFGPGARVVLHQPELSIRFLAEMAPAEAENPFGILRYDSTRQGFQYERANAAVRARIGEGFLIYARYESAAACFGAAAAERPDDPNLNYPWVLALAAAGHAETARARWQAAVARDAFPTPDTLAAHLLFGLEGARRDSAQRAVLPLAQAVTADPLSGPRHLALGRRLLDFDRDRAAAIELAAGCGIGKRSQDLLWLAQVYDRLGSSSEALQTYQAALAGGLDSVTYMIARRRFAELMRGPAGAAMRPTGRATAGGSSGP